MPPAVILRTDDPDLMLKVSDFVAHQLSALGAAGVPAVRVTIEPFWGDGVEPPRAPAMRGLVIAEGEQ